MEVAPSNVSEWKQVETRLRPNPTEGPLQILRPREVK